METSEKVDRYIIEQLLDQALVEGYFEIHFGQWFARLENRTYTFKGPKKSGTVENIGISRAKNIFLELLKKYQQFEANGYFYHYYNGSWRKNKRNQ